MSHPTIQVGIMSAAEIDFNLHGIFRGSHVKDICTGIQHVVYDNGRILDSFRREYYDEMYFHPDKPHSFFELQRVTIGITFHWERTEPQNFRGALKIIAADGQLTAINIIGVEEYLQSVISSEMKAAASPEFLKVHAIISRSWLLAQIGKKRQEQKDTVNHCIRNDEEWIQWFDREEHRLFDVCADDHCQRYQGITRIISPNVKEAVDATCGMVLSCNHEICDTRFSKCCGGMTETFENVWEPQHYPYLTRVADSKSNPDTDLSDELRACDWILGSPETFCNTDDDDILSEVLNDYDLETHHFHRWKITFSQNELSGLIKRKSGIDFGQIIDLVPVKRGVSGRIILLKIEGVKRSMTIGKELLIRRFLSPTHLYSSAFVVEKKSGDDGIPESFTLHGAGWGHGVGLCQIGAAVMCSQGYTCKQVLEHYYPGTVLVNNYAVES
jgi:peptidoglycan hydrolase-like amidase